MPAPSHAKRPNQPAQPPVLRVSKLCFAYPQQTPLLSDLSVDLPAGIHLLQGDTGSGKSTLLRVLAGDAASLCAAGALYSGDLALNGQPLVANPAAYRQQVCWFNPRDSAWDALTPAALMAAQRALHPNLDTAAWQRHLAGFALGPHLDKPLYMLSTGSRHKAGLAVALAAGGTLTLLDEPTSGLDAASVGYLIEVLNALADAPLRALVLASSHGMAGLNMAGKIVLGGMADAG